MKTDIRRLCMYIPGIVLRFKSSLHTVAMLNCSDLIYHTREMQPWALRAEVNQIPHTQIMSQRTVGWHRFSIQAVPLKNILRWCNTHGLTSVLEI